MVFFKKNIVTVIPTINKKKCPIIYVLEFFILWLGRLAHVNYDFMHRLINLGHFPAFHVDKNYKCETCFDAKLHRSSFYSVKRSIETLRLIHINVLDLKYIKHPIRISISSLSLMTVRNTVMCTC